jgi:hypothetical protein
VGLFPLCSSLYCGMPGGFSVVNKHYRMSYAIIP